MRISPERELAELDIAPEEAVQVAAENGTSESDVSQLREPVQGRASVFRRVLRGHLPARVEPANVEFTTVAVEVKARPGAHSLARMAWSARCIATWVVLGLV